MNTWRLTLVALLLSAGCAKKLEGPTPAVDGVAPDAVCNAQLVSGLDLTGSGFAPLLTSAMTDARQLELPTVELTRTVDLSSASVGDAPVKIPDDPLNPDTSAVRWLDDAHLRATVSPDLALAEGLYDVTVTNPQGAASKRDGALLAVPPPKLTSLSRDIACRDISNDLTLNGAGFIRSATAVPTVSIGTLSLVPALSACVALPGQGGYQGCGALAVTLAAGALPAGTYPVGVTNPAPVQCVSASGPQLTLFDKPTITSLQPLAICSQANNQQLVLTGTGFLTVNGVSPTVRIGAQSFTPTPSNCTAVQGPTEVVQSCTTLTLTVPAGTFAPGSYPAVVDNPPAVGCSSSEAFTLEVHPPPTITNVQPTAVCSGFAVVTVTGTDFEVGASVTLNGVTAQRVTVTAGTTAVAEFPSGMAVGGPFAVTLTNVTGCSATSSVSVSVITGPQVFFVDPDVVYNGVATQATVYGTGFTGAVQAVRLVPSGGGTATALTFTFNAARPNQVQAVIPKSLAAGVYDLELNDQSSCAARLADAIRVVDQLTLALATPALSPAFGWTGAATAVTVFAGAGAAFLPVPRVYLNPTTPGPGTVATLVGAVSFIDATHLSALIPTPVLPVGSYDVIVVNPDGKVGYAASAFRVVSQPPPTIVSLSPGSVPNSNPATFSISGKDFRSPQVTLSCVDAAGVALATSPAANVTGSTATSISVSFNASVAGVACVVRVTDTDDNTYDDFSALVITNPAQNLYAAKTGPDLGVARRASVALGGDATNSARFLHVLGGDDGTGGAAFDTVESASLNVLGVPSAFFTQRYRLTQPRAFAAGAHIGRYLYIAGGSSNGTRLASVERAAVLDPNQREEVTDLLLETSTTTGVGGGTWYYRVAAVMAPGDAFNPDGENLPADPFPVRLPNLGATKFNVTVSWKTDPGAVKYRVYRSASAGAQVGTEQVIAEVTAPTTQFKDTGAAAISTDTPLPVGSTGKWKALAAALSTPREGPGVSWAPDPTTANKAYLYVLGGRSDATTALGSHEFLGLTLNGDGSQTAAASFTAGTASVGTARWQLGATQATNALSSRIPVGSTYIYALGGMAANGTTVVNATAAALVQTGGQLGTFTALPILNRAGYVSIAAGNYVFAFGGLNGTADTGVVSGEICGSGVVGCGGSPAPPDVANWNSGQTMLSARHLAAGTLSGAFIYVASGVGTGATLTKSTEYRLW